MLNRNSGALRGALALLALTGCGSESERAAPAQGARPANAEPRAPVVEPPSEPFVAPSPWQSKREGTAPIEPPVLDSWRAFASQDQPVQIKTPLWQPLAPEQTVELRMPAGSGFRCIVTPLQVSAEANDFGTKLKAWLLARDLRCSSDGFRTWTEHLHTVRIAPDGSRETPPESGALLRERAADGIVLHTYVLVRSDPEVRTATTGPPRILPGVEVDED